MERIRITETGCWEWDGYCNPDGYGQFFVKALGEKLAHRVAYIVFIGPIPEGAKVCHTCDNPPCIRPSHLFLGTQLDNMRDAVAKGRQAKGAALAASHRRVLRGEEVGNHRLTAEQVAEIRRRIAEGPWGVQAQLAREYGVSVALISRIKLGLTWQPHGPTCPPSE